MALVAKANTNLSTEDVTTVVDHVATQATAVYWETCRAAGWSVPDHVVENARTFAQALATAKLGATDAEKAVARLTGGDLATLVKARSSR